MTEVLDVGDKEFWPPRLDDGLALVREWLAAHGIDASDTYRVELHVADCPTLRIFRYATNPNGERFTDPASIEEDEADPEGWHLRVAVLPPLDVAMRIPPPVLFRTVGDEG